MEFFERFSEFLFIFFLRMRMQVLKRLLKIYTYIYIYIYIWVGFKFNLVYVWTQLIASTRFTFGVSSIFFFYGCVSGDIEHCLVGPVYCLRDP